MKCHIVKQGNNHRGNGISYLLSANIVTDSVVNTYAYVSINYGTETLRGGVSNVRTHHQYKPEVGTQVPLTQKLVPFSLNCTVSSCH